MGNWNKEFKIVYHIKFQINDFKDIKHNYIILDALDRRDAIKKFQHYYEDSKFIHIDDIIQLWDYS